MAKALHTGDDRSLYDRDFYTWTQDQAAALRKGRFKGLDLEHLAEEIEDLGKSERSAIESYAARILEHALKIGYWTWLGDRNARAWRAEIRAFQKNLKRKLRDSPGLKRELDKILRDAWEEAKAELARQAAHQGISEHKYDELAEKGEAAYPGDCPWKFDDLLNDDFPSGSNGRG